MPRIRTIKPEFWTDEEVVDLAFEHRLLFIGLWNFCDDEGYIEYRPKQIKMNVFPGDNVDVSAGVEALTALSLIDVYEYENDGKTGRVLHVRNWKRHQAVNRPAPSKYTAFDLHKRDENTLFSEHSLNTHGALTGERKGREGKGREGKYISSKSDSGREDSVSPPPSNAKASDTTENFDTFWNIYPRREKKPEAQRAYTKALKRSDAQTIHDAAFRYAGDPNREPQFTKLPTTWLNNDCWNDPPLPNRGGNTRPNRVQQNMDVVRQLSQPQTPQQPKGHIA